MLKTAFLDWLFITLPICVLLCLAIEAIVAAIDRRKIREREKRLREALRAEFSAGRETDEHALNVSPVGVKAAPAEEYYLAMRAGLKDFWKSVPVLEGKEHLPPPFEEEADIADGKRRFARIDDGRSYTYVPIKGAYVVPDNYDCAVASPAEVCYVVHYAKYQTGHGDAKRN